MASKAAAKIAAKKIVKVVRKEPTVTTTPTPTPPVTSTKGSEFRKGDFVVYPVHGVGLVVGIEEAQIPVLTKTMKPETVKLYKISFENDRMILKVPVIKAEVSGLRRLSSRDRMKEAMSTLQGRSRVRRVMWSRRAQEYESKINSGDPVAIAEVLRDLHRASDQPEQSYSERQIYQSALDRLARELAAIEKIDQDKAAEKLEVVLSKDKKSLKQAA
jgi:CarD family transcriptional regulator